MDKVKFFLFAGSLLLIFCLASFLVVRYVFYDKFKYETNDHVENNENNLRGEYVYPREVMEIILQDIDILRESLIEGGIVLELVGVNERHKGLTENDIIAFDVQWRESEASSHFIKNHLDLDISRILAIFQEDHPQLGFSEIFVTDFKGVNVGQTNKTSDYYQADEEWWQKTVENDVYIGNIEFDESVRRLSIPVSFLIKDEDGEGYMGVVRGLIDVLAIRRQL